MVAAVTKGLSWHLDSTKVEQTKKCMKMYERYLRVRAYSPCVKNVVVDWLTFLDAFGIMRFNFKKIVSLWPDGRYTLE